MILNAAPRNTRVFVLAANEHFLEPQTNIRHRSLHSESINRWIREVTRWRTKVTILNIRSFVASDAEVHNWGHFDCKVYFRVYQEIERRMLR
jgi:hypothetical protein